jgi:hypothetical protein
VLPSSPTFTWLWIAALVVTVLSLGAPAPRRAIRSELCLIHVVAGIVLLIGGVLLALAGYLFAGTLVLAMALLVGTPAFWVARAPFPADGETASRDADSGDEDDNPPGGSRREEDPPPTPPAPEGIDWRCFDDVRTAWERDRDREREPVAR